MKTREELEHEMLEERIAELHAMPRAELIECIIELETPGTRDL